MTLPPLEACIGRPLRRKEDRRFLMGRGRYVADLIGDHDYACAFVRSPHAHARIAAIDTGPARALPGVVAVFTGRDLLDDGIGPIPCAWTVAGRDGATMAVPRHYALAPERVRHVGDAVALVVATSAAVAETGAEQVAVDYRALPAVTDGRAALAPDAPLIWDEAPGNLCLDWAIGDEAAVARAFAAAARVVEIELTNNRLAAAPLEPRAAQAAFDPGSGRYTLHTTSQSPHGARGMLSNQILGIPEHRIRVVSPDVGGGFGTKIFLYPEETALTWAAAKLDRPLAWVSSRVEAFLTDAQGRDHATRAAMALDGEGRITGLRVETVANVGAYLSQGAPAIPTHYYAPLLSGVYRIPAIFASVKLAFTNTTPVDAYRGAGRPEAAYVLERLIDKAARESDHDRIDLRRRNFIPKDAFPYETALGLVYDSGDHEGCLDKALAAIGWAGFEARRAAARSRGRLRGLGLSTYLEIAGGVPSRVFAAMGAPGGRHEAGEVRVHPSGNVTVSVGTHSQGQGHETAFAQLAADRFGLDIADVEVVFGDTDRVHFGRGTVASRSLPVGGSAIWQALGKVEARARAIAAHALQVAPGEIEAARGSFRVKNGNRALSFREVAAIAYAAEDLPPDDPEPGLAASAHYEPENWTYPGGCHVCELEVDPETGAIDLLRLLAVDDVGTLVNPMIVEGQIQGGLAQGAGQALFEQVVFDRDSGQPLTGSFMDYALPRADSLPALEVLHHTTPCAHNPLGAKGCAEVGTVGLPPAIVNAALDALQPLGVGHLEMPLTPERIWRAIRAAEERDQRKI